MITDEQIADACNKAYLKAGHNAYFGNGFEAGVRFALEQVKNLSSNTMLADSKNLCGWMPIDGIRLPERGEKVLVLFGKIENILIGRRMNDADGNDVWTVFFSDGEHPNFGENAEDITHWMELPSLPSVG